ncbi:MAG: hypothetical protein K1060chlam2_00065 [Chlamydiae bacterium]|nr:hypothetical protein [Chlamydiota bacterium]
MKKTFLAGLAILLPIAVTFFIIFFIVDFVTAPFVGIVEDLITEHGATELAEHHYYLLLFISRIIVLILCFLFVLLLGFFGRRIFFSWFINLTDRIFYKIPIIKTIYKISREVSNSFLKKGDETLFKGTVAVPFPHTRSEAFGLLSGTPPKAVTEKKEGLQTVFIPTAPHPISGFLLMYKEEEIKHTDIETEELLKFLLSCGVYKPWEESSK